MALPFPVSPLPFTVLSFSVFRTCNVRKKIGLPHTFSSGRVTSGNCQPAFLCSYSSCSKSFGESTPHRDACRAHRSPNSPISPRLVRPPPLEGPPGHINPKTIWNNAIPAPLWSFREVCVALPDPVSPLPFPVLSFSVFRTCNVRKKIGLPHTFSS